MQACAIAHMWAVVNAGKRATMVCAHARAEVPGSVQVAPLYVNWAFIASMPLDLSVCAEHKCESLRAQVRMARAQQILGQAL